MNNKLLLSLSITLLIFSSVQAQVKSPVKKIYAYKQAGIPGISPSKTFDEKGNAAQAKYTPRFNYWFYIETPGSEKLIISDLWISGKRFSAKNEPVDKTPVQKINYNAANGPDTSQLVPKTANKVILTYPSGQLKDSRVSSRYLSKLISRSELVIGYFWKGKKYFVPVKRLILLEPEASQ